MLAPKLGIKIFNALMREGITTVEQLTAVPEERLLNIRTFGQGMAARTAQVLAEYWQVTDPDRFRRREPAA